MDATTTSEAPVTELTETECWNLLGGVALGRLVTTVTGWTEIFPVNFVVQKDTLLFRTAEGTKLLTAALNEYVVFEADDHDSVAGWSVIVRGKARLLSTAAELAEARRAGLHPWIATQKQRFVRIKPQSVTGRRFVFGPEPEGGALVS